MVSTASISSLGSLRPFIERAFRKTPVRSETPEVPASCAAPLPHPVRSPHEGAAMDQS
ncbi:hypothetical protein [Desulfolutivibrio sp.]|uniref:hypothetical protein n=1 Tax=Desulfolutivibrio sp. TaxID=2773296 RepID=UPI002F96CF68